MKKIGLQTDLSKNIAPPVYVFLLFLLLFFSALSAFAQAGKDGALTVTTANTVLNRYTRVTTDVLAGSNTITVADINDLNRDGITYLPGGFVTNSSVYANNALSTGDLVVMYQAQGAIINATNTMDYGTVTNFNGAGTFEFAIVESVSGNTITLGCRTKNSYFADRYVQVLRVPQYTTLTVNAGASVAAIPWGSPAFGGADPSALTRRRGGFMVVHSTNIVNNGTIHANDAGFRGGTRENNTSTAGAAYYVDFRTNDSFLSAEKGESIAGYRDDYDNLYNGRYGRGAPANGGGGGNAHNAGGGGGANGGNPAGWFRGAGVMNDFRPAAGGCGNPGAWALDPDYIANGNALTNSQGGGRGGYSFAFSNQNACILGPSYPANFIAPGVPASNVLNTSWGGDRRDAVGGLGGRPLVSNSFQNQIFFGGGGGAGDGNNNANNDGGDGGGIVFLIATGNITGSGIISANGENGFNTLPSHNDAPGGGGGGGTVAIQTTSIANTISIRANGGNGGSQLITNDESEGPGGGGGGGVIAINATTDGSTKQVNGGQNGTTSSAAVTEFIANGATSGNSGTITTVSVNLFSVVCTANLGINKTVDNSTPNVGSNVTFTITVTNAGPDPATGVVVNDLLPAGYTFVSATPSQGTYNNSTGVWNVGNIGISGTATLSIVATVNASGPYTNTATVSSPNENDPNTSNNTSSVTPTPVPQANLGVTKTASNMMPPIGSNITFTITASNAGPSNATGVVVNDLLPSGYTFVSATASQGTYNNVTGVWSVGSLANGGSATLTITVTVNATGSYANTATISGDENDPTPANNTSTSTPTPVNLAPDAVNDSYTMPQNGNLSNSVATNDILQAGGNPHTFSLVSGGSAAANGTLVFNSDGTFTYTPNTGFSGTVSFTYQVCNSVTPVPQCDTAVATIVVLPPPVAVNDTAATPINTPVNGNASTNDNLPSGGTYTYTVTTPPANGSVVMNPDGTYTYTPNTGFTGTDTFTYQVCNQVGQCSTATVTVTVLPPPVAVNDSAVTPINTPVNGNASTNDNLPSGGTYTYTVTTPPANGSVVMNPDGTYTYTPNTGFTGTDTFTYQVCNQVGQCSTATVTVTVLPPPVAVNDSAVTPINTPVNGNASTNDNLPSGGTYTYTVTTPPTNGNVTMNPDGTYTYTPNTGFTGTDTFTYQVCNQVGQCSTATVTVTVLPPPVAVNDSAVTPINTPVNGNASTNDNLPSGGTYTYTVTTPPANGSVVMNPDGTYTYTPNTGFTGTDTFTYQVCNQVGQCSTATVTVTVLPPPVAVNDSAVTPINTPVNGNASTNDNLPSGGTYTYTVTTPPANGSVVMNPDGTYTYTPNTGFTGTDTFTYQVCNQVGQCSTATVTVTVLPPPVAVNDSAVTPINTPVSGDLGTNDNLPAGGTYTFSLVDGGSAAANGTLVVNPDGTYTFTPNPGFSGVVTFTYQVCNQAGVCSTATVTITVLAPPVANNDTAGTLPNTPVNGNVSSNDNLPAGGTYTYTVATPPANGSVVMNPDGTYTYTPNPGFVGTDTFTYTVCNQLGECSTATVTITVGQPPVANNDEYNTGANTPVSGNVGTNDQNPSGGATTYNLVNGGTAAQNGTLVFNPDGTFTFTPNQGFVGTVTFTYEICNPVGCSQATVTINVAAPVQANDDNFNATPGNPVNGNVGANDQIPAGQNPTYTLVNGGTAAANGTLVFNPNGTFTFTPNAGFVGTVSFTYQVCNEFGQCSTATVTIVVEDPVVQIPEGFSPNNDGINDTFVIKGRNGRPVDLKIYNRWGNLVYENPNYQDEWNGTSNIGIRIGEQLPDGTYYYTAEFKDTGERYARYLTIRR